MNARRWATGLLWALAVLPARCPAYCQSTGAGPVVLDLAATTAEDWRIPVEDADVAPELTGVGIRAWSVVDSFGRTGYLGVSLPFSPGTGVEAFTVLYAGPATPPLLLSEVRIRLRGLNTRHSLAILLRDGRGGLHEVGLGELDFDGSKMLICKVVPAVGPVAFAGIRVYASATLMPRERRLLLLLSELRLTGGGT